MPLIGHALVGAGVATATIDAPRSPAIRYSWPGFAILLAYWPDAVEWYLRLAGAVLPHSAPASLPCAVVSIAGAVLVLKLLFREHNMIVLTGAAAAILSHTLLDAIDGGIPLWWPFSDAPVGPNWLRIEGGPFEARAFREILAFGPVVPVGLLVLIVRQRPGVVLAVLSAACTLGAIVAAIFSSLIAICMATVFLALIAAALFPARRGAEPPIPFKSGHRVLGAHLIGCIVPVLPILVLAGAEFYARDQMKRGVDAVSRGDWASAAAFYERSASVQSLGENGAAACAAATCYARLGQEEKAHDLFVRGMRRNPGRSFFYQYLAEFHLTAQDPRFHRPEEALALAEGMRVLAKSEAESAEAAALIEKARAALSDRTMP